MVVRRYILNHQVYPRPPLFFFAVKTNVDYPIGASSVTHDETTESLTEALGVVREWNPGWSPGYRPFSQISANRKSILSTVP